MALRTIHCPHCNAERQTKAAPRMRLRCSACGEAFRAPNVADDLPEGVVSEPAAPAAVPPAPASPPPAESSSGVRVRRARAVVGKPVTDPVSAGADAERPAPPRRTAKERAQAAGRRGGQRTAKKAATPPSMFDRVTGRG